jgi:hypothetical protein
MSVRHGLPKNSRELGTLKNVYDNGLIYTEAEYRTLLADAGFVDTAVRQAAIVGQALISARKPT